MWNWLLKSSLCGTLCKQKRLNSDWFSGWLVSGNSFCRKMQLFEQQSLIFFLTFCHGWLDLTHRDASFLKKITLFFEQITKLVIPGKRRFKCYTTTAKQVKIHNQLSSQKVKCIQEESWWWLYLEWRGQEPTLFKERKKTQQQKMDIFSSKPSFWFKSWHFHPTKNTSLSMYIFNPLPVSINS